MVGQKYPRISKTAHLAKKHLDAVLLQVGLIGPFLAVHEPSSARFALSGEIAESVQRMAAVSSTGTGRARPR